MDKFREEEEKKKNAKPGYKERRGRGKLERGDVSGIKSRVRKDGGRSLEVVQRSGVKLFKVLP